MEMSRRRIIVVSDLHLGGHSPCMMSRPERLATFVESLPGRIGPAESLELVIAGDFVDFLAIEPHAAWSPDPEAALKKLATATDQAPFKIVFEALSRFVRQGHQLTVLVGNHDVELGLPAIQEAMASVVGGRIRFVDDGSAYRIGGLIIEHGNRYDPPNENDWGALRAIKSAQSRFEYPHHELDVSSGSNLVHRVLNKFKSSYPFLDLIQPQNELLLYLLLALEPALRSQIRALVELWRTKRLADAGNGKPPPSIRKVRAVSTPNLRRETDELSAAFPELYDALSSSARPVGAHEWMSALFAPVESGLAARMRRGERPTGDDLKKLRLVARRALANDTSANLSNVEDNLAIAAGQLLGRGMGKVRTIVMGHTHLAREVGPTSNAALLPSDWREHLELAEQAGTKDIALYINTGTWADRVRVDFDKLDEDEYLTGFLQGLVNDVRPELIAHFADITVAGNGEVVSARLCEDTPP